MTPDVAARFWPKVVRRSEDECWDWIGSSNDRGYGQLWVDGRIQRAHRLSFEHFGGPIPEGLVLDHLCRNTSCVNPRHLEAVTDHVNILRSDGLAAQNARKTHCSRGHEFTPENTKPNGGGRRECRICRNERRRSRRRSETCA